MRNIRQILAQSTMVVLLPIFLSACALADEYRWTGVPRVVAVSDPHGAYDALVHTLSNAGILDESLAWSGGDAHLVITGDLMDRGPESRRIMDLVMRLEAEAATSGGMVHLTLGNHEVMNLVGDLRYVSRAEFAAFADEEPADEREAWFQRYRASAALLAESPADEATLRAEFDKARPPGFYAHRRAFGSEGKYGRWLLQKPMIVVVNETAFVHGGLPPMMADSSLDELNDDLRTQVANYVRQAEVLSSAGLLDPAVNFYDQADATERLETDPESTESIRLAAQTIAELGNAPVHGPDGPLWYRGTVSCSALSESDLLDHALSALGATRLVVGHTPTVTHQVLQRFGGRVIEIDTGMLSTYYKGSGNALVLEGETVSVVNESGNSQVSPVPHPRRVGTRPAGLSVEALEQLLVSGEIAGTETDLLGRKLVRVTDGDQAVKAIFAEGPRRRNPNTELAAYRLDRLLGLDIVPVTVAREVDGKKGTLQFLPPGTQTEVDRAASGRGAGARCALPQQWNSMYVFDALIYNEGRTPSNMIYDPADWQLMSVGHQKAFGTKGGRPGYLATVALEVTGGWRQALSAMSDDVLTENLGDVLDSRRIAALAKRRDSLLND